MNVPSPALVKKQIDQKKALETYEIPTEKHAEKTTPARTSGGKSSTVSVKKNSTNSGSSRSTKSTSKTTDSVSGSSTSTTKRKRSSTKSQPREARKFVEKTRESFVRPEHLTTRPLSNNHILQNLKKELEKSNKASHSKKENN